MSRNAVTVEFSDEDWERFLRYLEKHGSPPKATFIRWKVMEEVSKWERDYYSGDGPNEGLSQEGESM